MAWDVSRGMEQKRPPRAWAWRLAACLILALAACLTATAGAAREEGAIREPAEVQVSGRLSPSLKRTVILPFAASITALAVTPGQRVQAGQELARYRLTPEAVQAVRRRLAGSRLPELESHLAQVEKELAVAESRWRTAQALAREQLGSRQAVAEAERTVRALRQSRAALAHGLGEERRLVQEERRLLSRQLGVPLSGGASPEAGVLTSPITGHVLWLHQDLREGAELKAGEPVIQVGVLDPMLLSARVHERDLSFLVPGLEARVTVEALGHRAFEARLSRLPWSSPAPVEQPAYFEAEFLVPNPELLLKEGMKATLTLKKP